MKNKKIISSLLIISMMMCLMPLKMFMATEPSAVNVKIVADKETATKGGKVNYTIKMDANQDLGAFKLKLGDIPENLTFDVNSATLASGVEDKLGIDEAAFKAKIQQAGGDITKVPPMISFDESNKVLLAYGCNIPDTTTGEITLATFSCTVSDQANVGDTLEVAFAEHTLATKGSETTDPMEITSNAVSATVTVTDAPQRKKGDVNFDQVVNTTDVNILYQYVKTANPSDNVKKFFKTDEDFWAANINGDKNSDETHKINTTDVNILYQYVKTANPSDNVRRYFEE